MSTPEPSDELRREVLVAHRRQRLRVVILVGGVATALACAWIVRPRERIVREREVVSVPIGIAIPIEREVEVKIPAAPAQCPLPHHDATTKQPTELPENVDAVRPSSSNAGWIAAWNAKHIFMSRDAGQSWGQVLDGPGDVHDVSFDCFGRVIAVRGTRVGVGDLGDAEWHSIPLRTDAREGSVKIFGGGPDVAIGGFAKDDEMTARLAVSRDGGATWRTRTLVEYWEGDRMIGRQFGDGTIAGIIPLADCDSYTQVEFRYVDGRVIMGDETRRDFGALHDDTDPAGYVWRVRCGQLAKAQATRGSDPRDESTDEADEAECDPS